MRAYNKSYLGGAADKFGSMMDYAVNDCLLDGDRFLHMFIASGLAGQFEMGKSKIIAKMSGTELSAKAITIATGAPPSVIPAQPEHRTAEYWAGWALAHYQWYTAKTFSSIIRYLPYSDIVAMYHQLCDADIAEFYKAADDIISRACPQTNLQRIRDAAGLSQAKLAREAGVSLRSIEMLEQRSRDINKSQAMTVSKIARALGCAMEDLLE